MTKEELDIEAQESKDAIEEREYAEKNREDDLQGLREALAREERLEMNRNSPFAIGNDVVDYLKQG